ncbi:hypothetical protein [Paenibacillus sp. GP183]|uniref:hypothetical protein n=1 Tax=Paenibacillus sp. GP183 TaxID=1882751 RepID=UPI001115236B|nr:hypothetical protein [Paenibacillus sp. GP183]
MPIPYLFLYDGDNGSKVDTETEKHLNVYELENLFLTNPSAILSAIKDMEYVIQKSKTDVAFAEKIMNIKPQDIQETIKEKTAKILGIDKESVSIEQTKNVKGSNVIKELLYELLERGYSKPYFAKLIAKYLSRDDLLPLKEKLDSFLSEKKDDEPNKKGDFLEFIKKKNISLEEAREFCHNAQLADITQIQIFRVNMLKKYEGLRCRLTYGGINCLNNTLN